MKKQLKQKHQLQTEFGTSRPFGTSVNAHQVKESR